MSAETLGVPAVVGLVTAFSLSSTLVKRAESPGVLVAFWRMIAASSASGGVGAVAALGAVIAWRHLPQRTAPATRAGAVTESS